MSLSEIGHHGLASGDSGAAAGSARMSASPGGRFGRDLLTTGGAAILVAFAGAGRGVSPRFEAGWTTLLFHAFGGLFVWAACSGLLWNVVRRASGFSAGYLPFARAASLAAIPLAGLWLNAIPGVGGAAWFEIALHGLAGAGLVGVTRSVLGVSLPRALGMCAVALGLVVLMMVVLGILFMGEPAGQPVTHSLGIDRWPLRQ